MKSKCIKFIRILFLFVGLTAINPCQASGWSWGIGYHNPPGSLLGLNFMHLWTNWAFEVGLGYISASDGTNSSSLSSSGSSSSSSSTKSVSVGGDINLKYLFGSNVFRPYLQGGLYSGVGASNAGNGSAGISMNAGFGGLGFFLIGSSFNFYMSYLFVNSDTLQAGLVFH